MKTFTFFLNNFTKITDSFHTPPQTCSRKTDSKQHLLKDCIILKANNTFECSNVWVHLTTTAATATITLWSLPLKRWQTGAGAGGVLASSHYKNCCHTTCQTT